MDREELNKILENHRHWLNRECEGWDNMRADLRGADLSEADLSEADLREADLSEADLRGADLRGADLRGADLRGADLRRADLFGADLRGADLREADLSEADLSEAKNIPFIPLFCPSDGAFVGWKKVKNKLIKLQIPEDAKRCSANSEKCRCDKALVLGIYNLNGSKSNLTEILNTNKTDLLYKVGEMVYPDSYDEDRWNECSHGIHFFINKENAILY